MNRYLSSRERESMARLMALVMVEGEAIKSYEKVSDLDKDFMKYLRMSHTFSRRPLPGATTSSTSTPPSR